MTTVTKINENTVKIISRIDSNNAAQFEKELFENLENASENIVLDADELEYISSAGLRVLLKLKKSKKGNINLINASNEVYDIFEVTGFSSFLNVSKKLREISVEGCEIIGQGGNGTVYRLDEDTIVKLYSPTVSLEKIEKEREFAKNALINGVPCVIAYDVVKSGDSYGIVFEMLKSDTLGHAMKNDPDRLDEYIDKYVELAKTLHGIEVEDGKFTPIKEVLHKRVPNLAKWCSEDECKLLDSLIDELPDEKSLIHGDLHPGNIMIQDGELLLIDMPEVTTGAKLWDLVGTFRDLISGPQSPNENAVKLLEKSVGMPKDMLVKTGYEFFKRYMGITNKEELEVLFKKLGLVYAFNVVLIVGAGSPQALKSADVIMEHLFREQIIPNEQVLREIIRSFS